MTHSLQGDPTPHWDLVALSSWHWVWGFIWRSWLPLIASLQAITKGEQTVKLKALVTCPLNNDSFWKSRFRKQWLACLTEVPKPEHAGKQKSIFLLNFSLSGRSVRTAVTVLANAVHVSDTKRRARTSISVHLSLLCICHILKKMLLKKLCALQMELNNSKKYALAWLKATKLCPAYWAFVELPSSCPPAQAHPAVPS